MPSRFVTLPHVVEALAGAIVVAGAAVAAQVPPTDGFWPDTVGARLALFIALGTAVGQIYTAWRHYRRPSDERDAEWRKALDARVQACEDSQRQVNEMTATLREVRSAQIAFQHLAERLDQTVGRFGRELSHLQGAFDTWDGRTDRRHHERRHRDPEET